MVEVPTAVLVLVLALEEELVPASVAQSVVEQTALSAVVPTAVLVLVSAVVHQDPSVEV